MTAPTFRFVWKVTAEHKSIESYRAWEKYRTASDEDRVFRVPMPGPDTFTARTVYVLGLDPSGADVLPVAISTILGQGADPSPDAWCFMLRSIEFVGDGYDVAAIEAMR